MRFLVFCLTIILLVDVIASAQVFVHDQPGSAGNPKAKEPATQPSISDKHVTIGASSAKLKLSSAKRNAAKQEAQAELDKLQVSEERRVSSATDRAKATPSYKQSAQELLDAETAKQSLAESASREQRSQASAAVKRANSRLNEVTQTLVASDPEVLAARKRISELRAKIQELSTIDLLDTLGDEPNAHAIAGKWEFKGDSLRASALSNVEAVPSNPTLHVFEPGLTDERGNPMAWQRATIHFPGAVPEQYALTIHLKRIGDAAGTGPDIMVPVHNGTLVCQFDTDRRFGRIGQQDTPELAKKLGVISRASVGPLLRGRGPHEIEIHVEAAGRRVVVAVDGKPAGDWRNDLRSRGGQVIDSEPVSYPIDLKGQLAPPRQIGISVTNSLVELLDVSFREIAADAPPTETGPPVVAAGRFPSIAGVWQEAPGVLVTITQIDGTWRAWCQYTRPNVGEIRWEMSGTISVDGEVKGSLHHTMAPSTWARFQSRQAKLSDDHNTISGTAKWENGGGEFTWTRVP